MRFPKKLKNIKLLLVGILVLVTTPLAEFLIFSVFTFQCNLNACEFGILRYYIPTFLFGIAWTLTGLIISLAGTIKYILDRRH